MEARVHRWRTALIWVAWMCVAGFAAGNAQGANLVVQDPRQNEDGTLVFPVLLTADVREQVAALQFDVAFEPESLSIPSEGNASPGTAAQAAEKSIHAASTRAGALRVIVAGLNQNIIESGTVAELRFERHQPSQNSADRISLTNVLMSDPTGLEVPIHGLVNGPVAASREEDRPAGAATDTGNATRSDVILLAVVLTGAAVGWSFLSYRKTGKRRRSRP